MWGRKTRCFSSSAPSSFPRTLRRSWSRRQRRGSFSCRWRRASSTTTSTAPQRRPCSWPRTPFRPSSATTTRRCIRQATWAVKTCSLKGNHFFLFYFLFFLVVKLKCELFMLVLWMTHGSPVVLEYWISTNSTRSSGRRGFKCGMKNIRAWWGDSLVLFLNAVSRSSFTQIFGQ